MKKIILIIIFSLVILLWNCNNDDNNNNNSIAGVENTQRTIANLPTNYFQPTNIAIKGIVLLGSGNNAQNPTTGSITDPYLITTAQELASKGFVCAIVAYRDQPAAVTSEDYNNNFDMLITDFNNVGNALRTEFNLTRDKLVFGGASYTANCLLNRNAFGTNAIDIKGILAYMGACSQVTAENQKTPVLAYACSQEPYGTHFGNVLVNAITNNTIKTKSYGLIDSSCSGHNTSNNWIADASQKVANWFN
jgi:hypothetical protein